MDACKPAVVGGISCGIQKVGSFYSLIARGCPPCRGRRRLREGAPAVGSCGCGFEMVALRRLNLALQLLTLAVLLVVAGCNGSSGSGSSGFVHFVPNSHSFWSKQKNWTTSYGPAYADITLAASNFVPCRGGPYALCYYSGPNTGSQDLSCILTPDGKYANCQCYDIPYGVYFVDINAILNHKVYEDTIAACGMDGSRCGMISSAPVCQGQSGNLDAGK